MKENSKAYVMGWEDWHNANNDQTESENPFEYDSADYWEYRCGWRDAYDDVYGNDD